jgi:hypothetical protein
LRGIGREPGGAEVIGVQVAQRLLGGAAAGGPRVSRRRR